MLQLSHTDGLLTLATSPIRPSSSYSLAHLALKNFITFHFNRVQFLSLTTTVLIPKTKVLNNAFLPIFHKCLANFAWAHHTLVTQKTQPVGEDAGFLFLLFATG